jgi:DNA polymerase III delta prime subunit
MTIQQLYAKHQGRLRLLGGPGAGKTTLLLELARDLLDQAAEHLDAEPQQAPSEPLPVVFHLATWATHCRRLEDWLVEELRAHYGLRARLAEEWVAHQQVAPLLDGLDEVAEAHRGACVAAINQFAAAYGQLPLVVCCRIEEFDALATRVRLGGAVVIRPLDRAQVQAWLREGGRALAGLRAVLRDDQELWELLDSPLLLGVMTLAYLCQPAAKIRTAGNVAERRRRLFDDFVEAMLARERTPVSRGWSYPPQQTRAWLGWLARILRQRDQSVFYLHWIQPYLLPTRAQRWLASYGIAIAAGLVGGLVVGLVVGLVGGLVVGLRSGLVVGLVVGVVSGLDLDVVPGQSMRWSWRSALSGAGFGLAFGLSIGLSFMLFGVLFAWSLGGLSGGLGEGLLVGLILGLVGGLPLGLLAGLTWLIKSGVTWVRYRVVCWLLTRNDSLPGDPVRFLDEAADHVLLYRTGGGYLFIHRLVRDHLAEAEVVPLRSTPVPEIA